MPRFLAPGLLLLALVGCAKAPIRPDATLEQLGTLMGGGDELRWTGLVSPVALRVAANGDIYVADQGDGLVHVFSGRGTPIRQFGGAGDGPGEVRRIRDLLLLGDTVVVFDANPTRVSQWALDGTWLGVRPFNGTGDEMLAPLGRSRFVVASSARWAMPGRTGKQDMPLAQVVDLQGGSHVDVGTRESVDNPFANHISNFVLVAGTPDGRTVWLAWLNDPRIVRVDVRTAQQVRVNRPLPFKWRRVAPDVSPADVIESPEGRKRPPFDVVSRGIATDASGRAFVLTALQPLTAPEDGQVKMAIDILPADGMGRVQRATVRGSYSAIGVAPDGATIYLLSDDAAAIRTFRVPT